MREPSVDRILQQQQLKNTIQAVDGRIIITNMHSRLYELVIKENTLTNLYVESRECYPVGSICMGKVKNILKEGQAAFVEIGKDYLTYLPLHKNKRITVYNREVSARKPLCEGDEILVQVLKAPVKTKVAEVTADIQLKGMYSVLTTEDNKIHISSKLPQEVREKYRKVLKEKGCTFGLIVRTCAGELSDFNPLYDEIARLEEKLATILDTAPHRPPFSLLYKPYPAYLMNLLEIDGAHYGKIITDNEECYQELLEFSHAFKLHLDEKISFYDNEEISLQSLYGLSSKLEQATSRKVWLPCGGYLVIEPTEALTVIDVNSGKCTKGKRDNSFYWMINKEAAKEIARQLILRNLSGMIIIDFINMDTEEENHALLSYLKELVRKDKVLTRVIDMTPLGLVELTRKKIQKPLHELL